MVTVKSNRKSCNVYTTRNLIAKFATIIIINSNNILTDDRRNTQRCTHREIIIKIECFFWVLNFSKICIQRKKQRTYSLNVWIVQRAMMFFDCRKVMRNLLSLVSRTVVNIVSIVFQYASSLMKMSNIFIALEHLWFDLLMLATWDAVNQIQIH